MSLIDVAPILLAAAGIEPHPKMRGRRLPLSPEQAQTALPSLDLIAELHPDPAFEEHVVARSQRLSVVRWPWKRISGFDGDGVADQLESDPDDQSPLPASAGELPEDREREAAKWLRTLENLDRCRASSGE